MLKLIRQWFSSPDPKVALKTQTLEASARAAALRAQGNRYLDQGDLAQAEHCYRQAHVLAPTEPTSLTNLGYVLIELGRHPEARDCLTQAVALDGANFDSRYLLGTVLENLGDLRTAVEQFGLALALKPEFDVCCRDLVRVLFHLGRLEEAQTTLTQGLVMHPGLADLHFYQGHLAMAHGRHAQATQDYQRAAKLAPGEARIHAALGQSLDKQGALKLAADSFQAAVLLAPDNPDYLMGLADTYQRQGSSVSALAIYQKGLACAPNHAELLANMSLTLCALGQLAAAKAACERAIELAPRLIAARSNLGITLTHMGELHAAVDCLREAIEIQPQFAPAHCNLGAAYQKQGHLPQAIKGYRQALALDASYLEAHSNLLFALSFSENLSSADFLAEARTFGANAQKLVVSAAVQRTPPGLNKRQMLRVGMVSGDFREHPVGYFLENILGHLDANRIELFAYVTQYREDSLTQRIKPRFKGWRTIAALSDADAAGLVQQDGVDILMDLGGHTAHNRLPLFSWRPAPVAVSWLGWFASTGMQEMDYFLTDPVSVPLEHQSHFSENVRYLPQTRFCFTPPQTTGIVEVTSLPALRTGYPTFACFQQIGKINDHVLRVWSKIAAALPQARFHLQNQTFNTSSGCETFHARLRDLGLAPERFTLLAASSREEYLKSYQSVDIVLDTFPFNGATTTCEALWMGVPTITLAGDRLVSRQGASLMTSAGLADWVTDCEEAYITRAIQKATQYEALNELRLKLRSTVLTSPVFDAPRFAKHLLQALQDMQPAQPCSDVRV